MKYLGKQGVIRSGSSPVSPSYELMGLSSMGTTEDPNSRLNGSPTELDGVITVPVLGGWSSTDPQDSIWWGFPIKSQDGLRMAGETGGLRTIARTNYRLQLIDPLPAGVDVVVAIGTAASRGVTASANRSIAHALRTTAAGNPQGCQFTNAAGGWSSSFGSSDANLRGGEMHHIRSIQDGGMQRDGFLLDSNNDVISGLRFGSAAAGGNNSSAGGGDQVMYTVVSVFTMTAAGAPFTISFKLWAMPALIVGRNTI